MVEAQENEGAVRMISELAKLLRVSLSRGKTIISLKDELQHSRSSVSYTHLVEGTVDRLNAALLDIRQIFNGANYNVVQQDVYKRQEEDRSYYALNIAVTAENYNDFTDSTRVYDKVANQLDESKSPSKKVWLNIYNASDNFLSSTYQPLLEKYDDLLNLKVDYIGGDGQTESNITNLSLIHIFCGQHRN